MPDGSAPYSQDQPAIIEKYLENVRGTIPLAIEHLEAILRLISAGVGEVTSYLDLGSVSVVPATVVDEYPQIEATIFDSSRKRLDATRQQLGLAGERAQYRAVAFTHAAWASEAWSHAPFDLITSGVESALLPDDRQRAFYAEVTELLRPGGLFLSLQHVASATRWTQSRWDDDMIETIFGDSLREHEREPRTAIARAYYEGLATRCRQVAPLEVQCDWLRELGLEDVDCYLKISELAVFGGIKGHGR